MKNPRVVMLSLLTLLLCSLVSAAQQSATAANATVPPLIQFSNVATDEGGNTLSGVVNITFSLYAAQQGGQPLWTETQNNIQLDPTGHYSVQLGITQPNGVPSNLFTTGEARWLGVKVAEQGEQPRVLLLSVPYALKAGDSATLGGLPASAFVLAAPVSGSLSGSAQVEPMDAGASSQASAPPTNADVTGIGTIGYLPMWDATSDIIDSVLFQSGTGTTAKIGIATTTPASTLDVKGGGTIRGTLSLPAAGTATAGKGANSQALTMAASTFSTTAAVAETFALLAEPAGNDTPTPSATLNLLFGSGTTRPAETGLHVASNGQLTFAPGQTFPGAGTITGITTAAGSGLTGGTTSGTPSLSLLNTCATNQVLQWNGTGWACATISGSGGGSGTVTSVATGLGLLGGPILTSGTLTIDPTVVPQLNAANTFTGNQTVTGNVIATTGYEIQFAGTNYLFDYGTPFTGAGLGNSYLGFAGNATTTGQGNVAAGYAALLANTTGQYNTAVGLEALFTNSSGIENTAVGEDALFANGGGSSSTGNGNTAVGWGAAYSNNTGYNNTATGAHALYNNTSGVYNTATGGYALNNNTTGTYNTAIGYQSGPSTGAFTNTTAIGANATVSESNALVLGGTGANAVKVGIGTATPAYTLDAAGTIRSSSGGFMFPDGTTQTTAATTGGGGTVTSVGSGAGLTGGPITGAGTLSIAPGGVTNAMLATSYAQLGAANTFAANQTVDGTLNATANTLGNTIVATNSSTGTFAAGVQGAATATTGATIGVQGQTMSSSGYGLYGEAFSTTGLTYGVYGQTESPAGYGVKGVVDADTGSTAGVFGQTQSAAGYGVQGQSYSPTGNGTGVYGGTNSPLGYGVEGQSSYVGVYGTASSNSGIAVLGIENSTTGTTFGLQGTSESPAGFGVYGTNISATGTATGVFGTTNSLAGYGVEGSSPYVGVYGTGPGYGVEGSTTSSTGVAGIFTVANSVGTILMGVNSGATMFSVDAVGDVNAAGAVNATGAVSGNTFQIAGQPFAFGNYANANAFLGFAGSSSTNSTVQLDTAVGSSALFQDTGGFNTAVGGEALASNTTGDFNTAIGFAAGVTADNSNLTGGGDTALGYAAGFSTGSWTNATAIGYGATVSESNALVLGSGANVGIGTSAPTAALDVVGNSLQALIGDPGCGSGFAGLGFVNKGGFNSCGNYALLGDVPGNVYINSSLSGKIYFRNNNGTLMTIDTSGDVNIKGNLSKGGGSFKIDDPLDPANKYLYHSFVESPDMMNVYNGNITTNQAGLATVVLPDYFEALNRDFRYQLTVIGQFAQAIVAKEVSHGRFTIKTNRPGVKVSWQVTGIRQDAYANAHRIPTEVEKPAQEQGHYLHPELFGAGPEQAVGYDGSQSPATATEQPTPTGGSRR